MSLPTNQKSIALSRHNLQVLVVCAKGAVTQQVKAALKVLSFGQITNVTSHRQGIDRLKARAFTHMLFDSSASDMDAIQFMSEAAATRPGITAVCIAEHPEPDHIFKILQAGARGFIVPPFTSEVLEQTLLRASDGPPISELVLGAENRNAAFAEVILGGVYRLAALMRQAREASGGQNMATKEVDRQMCALEQSSHMAKVFCEGGVQALREEIINGCVKRADSSKTRLGKTRESLKKMRLTAGQVSGDHPVKA